MRRSKRSRVSIDYTCYWQTKMLTGTSNSIYDKTVPKPVLDILAEMIAADSELNVGPFGGPGSDSGIPSVGLD